MKRILSLIFVLILAVFLCACRSDDASSNLSSEAVGNQNSSISQKGEEVLSDDVLSSETEGTENNDESNPSNVDIEAHEHSFSEATCQAPKTCSVCGETKGDKQKHILSGTTCKWCNQAIAVSPSGFKPTKTYSHISNCHESGSGLDPDNTPWYVLTLLNLNAFSDTQAVYRETATTASGMYYYHHNGKYYENIAQSGGINGNCSYEIVGSEIVLKAAINYAGEAVIHFQLLSDGTLKVTKISGTAIPTRAGIIVGSIFYPNATPSVET